MGLPEMTKNGLAGNAKYRLAGNENVPWDTLNKKACSDRCIRGCTYIYIGICISNHILKNFLAGNAKMGLPEMAKKWTCRKCQIWACRKWKRALVYAERKSMLRQMHMQLHSHLYLHLRKKLACGCEEQQEKNLKEQKRREREKEWEKNNHILLSLGG